MEAGSKSLRFSDDEKSLGDVEAPRPSLNISNLEDLGERFDEVNSEVNIQVKYYQEFKKIYLTSFKLWTELRKQIKIKEGLTSRVGSIESQLTSLHKSRRYEEDIEVQDEGEGDSKRKGTKRMRRTAEEIERKFECMAQFCGRCYGSEGSLQQHIKLKHPQLYKKQGEFDQF